MNDKSGYIRRIGPALSWRLAVDVFFRLVTRVTQQDAEFSRIIAVDELGQDDEKDVTVSADPAACAVLAARLGLEALDRFEARVHLTGLRGGSVAADVAFEADVVQLCVVTLDPVSATVGETFDLVFEPAENGHGHDAVDARVEVEVTLEDAEPPEPMHGRRFDIGMYLAEYLALAIDPYPRKAGITLQEIPEFETVLPPESGGKAPADEETENPFSVLRQLTDTTSRNS